MRKSILLTLSLLVVSSLMAACAAPAPEVITQEVEVTRVVEGETVTVIEEVVVTATPAPVVKEEAPAVLGTFPRSETLIVRQLTGRVGTPDNFNHWVGWKWQDRGMQNLADEPLWSVDFATGERGTAPLLRHGRDHQRLSGCGPDVQRRLH